MQKKRLLKLRVLILALLSVMVISQNASAAATSVNVVGVKQINSNWCWAACCESIFRGPLNANIDQTTVVRDIMGPYLPDAYASDWQVAKAFADFGYSSITSTSYLTFAKVKEEINAGRPIFAHLSFRNSTVGHSVVICAYDTRNGVNYIWYMDPHTGKEYMQSFNEFVAGFKYFFNGQNAYWSSTVYGFKKK